MEVKKKILLIFGTRPEAIKMAPLVKAFYKYQDSFDTRVCVTGQHREMLDQVLSLFDIVPDYDLNIMKHGQDLYDVTSKVLLGMREVLRKESPSLVLVHGDTTTSMAAALAAYYEQVPVAHVEAGLRTKNIYSPWPEEMNRQMTGRIARYHFAPTILSRENLISEGVLSENIVVTGNTVIDALNLVLGKIESSQHMRLEVEKQLESLGIDNTLSEQWKSGERLQVLITGHRRENFGEGFLNICRAIQSLGEKYTHVDFVYPMHLNPNVRSAIIEVFGSLDSRANVLFVEPLDYLPFVYMMSKSHIVLTDSGGIQEEAPGLGKPVLVMRDNTERPEAVEAGTVELVGANKNRIIEGVSRLLENREVYMQMSRATNPYGDGKACDRIVRFLKQLK